MIFRTSQPCRDNLHDDIHHDVMRLAPNTFSRESNFSNFIYNSRSMRIQVFMLQFYINKTQHSNDIFLGKQVKIFWYEIMLKMAYACVNSYTDIINNN